MLGSLHDAEDVLQETLLAAWRGLAGFEQRASLRTWLYRIATLRCLNARRDAARRTPHEPVPPFDVPEPNNRDMAPWLQPLPDAMLAELPAAFLRASFAWRDRCDVRPVAAGRANTHPALGRYLDGSPAGLYVLAVAGDRVYGVTRFHDDSLFARFGLPCGR